MKYFGQVVEANVSRTRGHGFGSHPCRHQIIWTFHLCQKHLEWYWTDLRSGTLAISCSNSANWRVGTDDDWLIKSSFVVFEELIENFSTKQEQCFQFKIIMIVDRSIFVVKKLFYLFNFFKSETLVLKNPDKREIQIFKFL